VHPGYTPIDVRDALRRYAHQQQSPDSTVGWGRPDIARSTLFPRGVVLTGPSDTALTSVTPLLSWSVPDLPAAAFPVEYRVEVARDTLFLATILDTVLTEQSLSAAKALAPGERLIYRVTASTADSVAVRSTSSPWYLAPAWVAELQPDAPGGVTVRDLRPTFRWTSPASASPPGPFLYDILIERVDDGTMEVEDRDLTTTQFVPPFDLERNTPYRWSVTARLGTDSSRVNSAGSFIIVDDSAPLATLLYQNFPNPFPNRELMRDVTCLWFDLSETSRVELDILDARGHIVRNLVPGTEFETVLEPGRYGRPAVGASGTCDPRLEWDGTAEDGSVVPQGIYIARLVTLGDTFTKRIVFMGHN
jgi:hypothetical protein